MATAQHTASRRGMLELLAVAPIAFSAISATGPNESWQAILSAYEAADTAYGAALGALSDAENGYAADSPVRPQLGHFYVGDTVDDYHARLDRLKAQWAHADQAAAIRHDLAGCTAAEKRASDALDDAKDRLMATRAPDLAAVLRKLKVLADLDPALDTIVADLRRLGSH